MRSLRSRLALAKVALRVSAEAVDPDRLVPLVAAGVDLLVLAGSGDDELDVANMERCRSAFGASSLLLGTGNQAVAQAASADVVHVERPRAWATPQRGHRWTLLGRDAHDARTTRRPGRQWSYLFVGPCEDPSTSLLSEALSEQPPFSPDALPWFALGDWRPEQVSALVASGVRRVAVSTEGDDDLVARVAAISAPLRQAWEEDPVARAYQRSAAAW